MELPGRTRRNTTAPLVVTLLLGVAIGLSLGYVIFGPAMPGHNAAPAQSPSATADLAAAPAGPPPPSSSAPPQNPEAGPAVSPSAGTSPPDTPAASASEGPPGEAILPEVAPDELPPSPPLSPAPGSASPPPAGEKGIDAARHLFIAVRGTELSADTAAFLKELRPGGVVLTAENIVNRQQTIALVQAIKQAVGEGLGIADRPLIAVAQEGGALNPLRLRDAPTAEELGRAETEQRARDAGLAAAQSCVARGIGVLLGPSLDVYEEGALASMKARCFGSDVALVTQRGIAFMEGALDGGVTPIVKHYPGLGAAKQDPRVSLVVNEREVRTGLADMMFPFSDAAYRNVPGILAGHIAAPALDKRAPRRPASLSPVLLRQILRELWGYEGVIITDDLNAGAISSMMLPVHAAAEALRAGADIAMFLDPDPDAIWTAVDTIEFAVADGSLSRATLEASNKRLDAWQDTLRRGRFAGAMRMAAREQRRAAEAAKPAPPQPAAPPKEIAAPAAPVAKTPVESAEPAPAPPEPTETPPAGPPSTPPPDDEAPPETETAPQTPADKITHEIQKGDTLSGIAAKYGVKMDDIRRWNNLKDDNIKLGLTLIIYTSPEAEAADAASAPEAAPPDTSPPVETAPPPAAAEPSPEPQETPESAPAPAEEPAPAGGETTSPETPAAEMPAPAAPESEEAKPPVEKITYTIQQGDTLHSLARKFGVSIADIQRWNNLKDETIRWGLKLTIFPGAAAPVPPPAAPTDAAPPEETPAESADPAESP